MESPRVWLGILILVGVLILEGWSLRRPLGETDLKGISPPVSRPLRPGARLEAEKSLGKKR